MKLLFFSADGSEIDFLHHELVRAGIPCQVHNGSLNSEDGPALPSAELWIKNDGDYHKAACLCVRLGIGFDTRQVKRSARLWTDLDDQILQLSCGTAG
jgi:hypothetical protein